MRRAGGSPGIWFFIYIYGRECRWLPFFPQEIHSLIDHSLIHTLLGTSVFSVLHIPFNHYGSQSERMADDRDRLGLGGAVPDLCGAPSRGSAAQESRLRHGRLLEFCVDGIDDCHVGRTGLM